VQFAGFWSNFYATMLQILQGIDIALGLTMVVVIARSAAAEFRKLWKS
jgi:hypothetical protein